MKTENIKKPLYPPPEYEKCSYFRRNLGVLLGPLGDMLYSMKYIGHYICKSDFYINRSMEPSFLILLTLSGEGDFRYRNTHTVLKRGSCFLIDARIQHEYYPLKEGWEFKYIHFCTGKNIGLLPFFDKQDPVRILNEGELGRVEAILDRILDETEDEITEDYPSLSGEIYSILMLFITHDMSKAVKKKPQTAHAVTRAMEYIKNNYSRDISVNDIAREVNFSRSTLFKFFQLTYGMSPHDYLIQYRLLLAKDMLLTTHFSVSEIATRVGFKDIYAFSRRFRERNGMSPSEYRKQNAFYTE
ncbi:MAG: helix-turn-helix domain-containing protein [Clostridia bacterium]|nr:helix-turn-helix domain-containing protein [Clostridia bacterium]